MTFSHALYLQPVLIATVLPQQEIVITLQDIVSVNPMCLVTFAQTVVKTRTTTQVQGVHLVIVMSMDPSAKAVTWSVLFVTKIHCCVPVGLASGMGLQ